MRQSLIGTSLPLVELRAKHSHRPGLVRMLVARSGEFGMKDWQFGIGVG